MVEALGRRKNVPREFDDVDEGCVVAGFTHDIDGLKGQVAADLPIERGVMGGGDRTDLFVLFPHSRVSPVQQRQMTTSRAKNVHALSVEGNFDDCQGLVKDMFNDHRVRDGVSLSGVNSINWARIMAQIVYYFSSAISLGSPDRPVSFAVPTANFGDMFAGYAAKRMGLPIDRLVIATNDNDILARAFEGGVYETRGVVETTSPSMDIQVSSNFERLLFDAYPR